MGFSAGAEWVLIQGAEGFQDSPLTSHMSATKKVWGFVVACGGLGLRSLVLVRVLVTLPWPGFALMKPLARNRLACCVTSRALMYPEASCIHCWCVFFVFSRCGDKVQ